MLTLTQASVLGAHLASLHRTTIVTPDDAPARAARAILAAITRGVPALADLADELMVRASRVIATFGSPGKYYSMTKIYLVSPDGQFRWWRGSPGSCR